ncbi:hypothetical protein Tco_0680680 [Tanacetum coccineum]|uniref:Uncharacterized protein n=1 Tax=Tanacetum coccineum TaxID=301880 RepID=A0ABQ4XM33_9ASTR
MDNSFGSAEKVDHVRILQSCNGLLLCADWAWPIFYYIHNPSTNLFKRIPQPHYSHENSCFYRSVVLTIAFDPRKSFDYKVVQAGRTFCDTEIQIYSSETGNWILCRDQFNYFSWFNRRRNFLESFGGCSDDPILMLMEIPQMLHLEGKFFESCGCLLLVCRDDIGSREFTIYEMMKECSVWSVRYLVNTEELMNSLPEGWSIRSTV